MMEEFYVNIMHMHELTITPLYKQFVNKHSGKLPARFSKTLKLSFFNRAVSIFIKVVSLLL